MKILSGLKEIASALRLGKVQTRTLIREKKTPVKVHGQTYTVFEEDLLIWYREFLKK